MAPAPARPGGPLAGRPPGAALAVLLMGTVGSVVAAQAWQATVNRQRDERLDRTAATRTVTITSALANYENGLQATRSLWLASDSVSRTEFNAFARSLDLKERYPGLQAIGWRRVVTAGRRSRYYLTIYNYPRIPSSSSLGTDARTVPSVRVPWTVPATPAGPP